MACRKGRARLWLVLIPAVVFVGLAALFWRGLPRRVSRRAASARNRRSLSSVVTISQPSTAKLKP